MTMKTYIKDQMACYGYSRFDEIPEEMLDYLPEMLEDENNLDDMLDTFTNDSFDEFTL